MSTTITINPHADYPLASATLTALTRLDTDTSVTLPSPVTFTYDAGNDVWEIEADLPAGVEVYWEATVVYSAGGESGADGTVNGEGIEEDELYGSRAYIEDDLGPRNVLTYANRDRANLENTSTLADIADRIQAAIVEVNAEMRSAYLEWQNGPEFIPLGHSNNSEHELLDQIASWGASASIGSAWAQQNGIDKLPWQIQRAIEKYDFYLEKLRTGQILKEYYEEESDEADSGILALQEGAGPVAKLRCPLTCCETYDPDLYDCN